MAPSRRTLSETYNLALCDLDGTAYNGAERIPSAVDGIAAARHNGMAFVFVTNNASRTPAQTAHKLDAAGIPAAATDVMTSAMAAATMAAEYVGPDELVLAIGGDGVRDALRERGLRLTTQASDQPAAVVQGLAYDVSWRELTQACLAIQQGARYIATNLDSTLPTEHGFALGNGSLVAAVVHATGRRPQSPGKPAPDMFVHVCSRRTGATPIALGDRLNTDIAGGIRAGIDTAHVLTGVSSARDIACALPEERPTYLLATLRNLNEPYLPAQLEQTTGDEIYAQCGEYRVRVNKQGIYVCHTGDNGEGSTPLSNGQAVKLTAYRAIATACWQAADRGIPVTVPDFVVMQ